MELLISVIIPAYNIEKYIGRCLDSLLKQTYKNLEIIVVDDGSTDDTAKIIDEYTYSYDNIKVIHKANSGVSATRNTGIDIAKGDYIGFVDGDDTVDDDMFETLIQNAINYNADISHCGYKMVFPSRTDYYYNTGDIVIQDNQEGLKDLLKADRVEPGLWNKIYKSSLFEDIRLNENIKYNEDLLANFYLFKKAKKSVFYDKCLYNYMIRKGSAATKQVSKNKIVDPVLVLEEIKNSLEKGTDLYEIAYKRYLASLIGVCRNKVCRSNIEYIYYTKEAKEKLKEEYLNNKDLIRGKMKYMIYGVVYLPLIFNFIDNIHGTVSGNKYKYEVK